MEAFINQKGTIQAQLKFAVCHFFVVIPEDLNGKKKTQTNNKNTHRQKDEYLDEI